MKEKAIKIFKKNNGQLKMSEALQKGITRYTLYKLRDEGIIESVSKGIYRLTELPPYSNPDLVTVSMRFPQGIICLESALSFHEITTQIPIAVSIAIEIDTRIPKLDYPPIKIHKFSTASYRAGIEEYQIDDITVKVYNPEKTIADCFKFRNQIGMDIVLESLKLYKSRYTINTSKLIEYGKICRVHKIMKPYIEASL
jgi:predicted transcriptional regulator of viral defense system